MESVTLDELRRIEGMVTPWHGWNFSRMRVERDPVPWDYLEIVPRYLRPTDAVLDIGTGGGEKFLSFARYIARGVGIDPDPEMVRTARENGSGQENVTFAEMAAEDLAFPEASFDVVLTRHVPIAAREVVRILKPGGYFVTQGVGSQNMDNIRREFGTPMDGIGSGGGDVEDRHLRACIDTFAGNGCDTVATGAYDVRYWVKDVPSLIFWFTAIAGSNEIPAGFSIARDGQTVARIIETYSTPEGVLTNEYRTLLVARKRA